MFSVVIHLLAQITTKKNSNIFSDSKIAVSYKQGKTKIKCAIQFRMAPFVKEQLIKDFKLQPFSIKFDEATTSQVKKKKQYEGYFQF